MELKSKGSFDLPMKCRFMIKSNKLLKYENDINKEHEETVNKSLIISFGLV